LSIPGKEANNIQEETLRRINPNSWLPGTVVRMQHSCHDHTVNTENNETKDFEITVRLSDLLPLIDHSSSASSSIITEDPVEFHHHA
jgi:hypothetical protein